MLRDLEILKIDYTAANADYRITETHQVADLNGRVLIPYEGPFYARNLVVRGDGAPLTVETDYTLEDHFTELELMTGKKVIGSIRFSTRIKTDYKEIKVVYQKIGEFIISRNFLVSAIDQILNDNSPIDWLTKVFGKPDTYPPAAHNHDITKSDEIVGFHDIITLFKYASGDIKDDGLTIWNELKAIEEKAYKVLNDNYTTLWNKMFSHIMNVNKPHPMTKAELGLGDHPNYTTSTRTEDQNAAFYMYNDMVGGKLALRNDSISTPAGVRAAIDNFEQDTDGFIRQGDLPFSYYGSGFYLPPPVKGSFEGLGTDMAASAVCLEANGFVTALVRSYDSKVKGLYYYYNKDIYNDPSDFIFSGVNYTHPTIEADNAELLKQYQAANGGSSEGYVPLQANHVVAGSGGGVFCIGDYEKKRYYIGLGNGTLDPNAHILKRINTANFVDPVEGDVFDPFRSYVIAIGNYVYFIAQTNRWPTTTPDSQKFGPYSDYRMRIIYRVNKTDLLNVNISTVTFVKQLMNYQDTEGTWHYNQSTVELTPFVIGTTSSGKRYVKSMCIDFTQDPNVDFTQVGLASWRAHWVCKENPNDKTVGNIKFLQSISYGYYGDRTNSGNYWFCLPLTFDTKSNTLTIDNNWFKAKFNVVTGESTVPDNENFDAWYSPYLYRLIALHNENNAVWIDGIGIITIGSTVNALPLLPYIYFGKNLETKGKTAQWDAFMDDFSVTPTFKLGSIALESPFDFATLPGNVQDLWQYNDSINSMPVELFRSWNRNSKTDIYYHVCESAEYVKNNTLKTTYIKKEIYSRSSSVQYGKVRVINDTDGNLSWTLPCVNYPVKNQYSSQYGMFGLTSMKVDDTFPVAYSTFYAVSSSEGSSASVSMDEEGGFYLDTLGKHSINSNTNVLTIEPDLTGRIWITKTFWRGLLSSLLGSDDALITANGLAGTGEYFLTVCLSSSGSASLPVSTALLFYHQISTNPDVAKVTRMRAATFDWSSTETTSDGNKIATLGAVSVIGTSTSNEVSRGSDGKWVGGFYHYNFPYTQMTLHVSGTDKNNMDIWFSSGVQMRIPNNGFTPAFHYTVSNGVKTFTPQWYAIYTAAGIEQTYQAVYNGGLQRVVNGLDSGGSALYTHRSDGGYTLIESVFTSEQWTVFIGTDVNAMFNGVSRELKATSYSLNRLGIDPTNKTFYLYAVSGKTQGYYDLSLSEKTASPYHLLAATIKTNSVGIETITPQSSFAISGFTITASNRGGSIPASTGSFAEIGNFEEVYKDDLFDTSQYN